MEDTNKLTKLGKSVVKTSIDRNMTKTQLTEVVGASPQYLSYVLYGIRSGEKYIPTIIAALEPDPRKVEKVIVA